MRELNSNLRLIFWALCAIAGVLFGSIHSARGEQLCDLPIEWRKVNHNGSCGHCSTFDSCYWNQIFDDGDKWWATYQHGENFGRHLERARKAGFDIVYTNNGDPRIFDIADETRRMAIIYVAHKFDNSHGCDHIVCYIGKRNGYRYVQDNHDVEHFVKFKCDDREDVLVRRWKNWSGCALIVLKGTPPPPLPED